MGHDPAVLCVGDDLTALGHGPPFQRQENVAIGLGDTSITSESFFAALRRISNGQTLLLAFV